MWRKTMNKKNLINQGYSFEKIGKDEYLDLSVPKKRKKDGRSKKPRN